MLFLIAFFVILIGGAIAIAVVPNNKGWVAAGVGTVLLIVTVVASFTSVEARSIAIQTSFGKFDTVLGNGIHFIAPWADTEQFDTTIQTIDLADEFAAPKGSPDGGKVQVAFKGGGQGWINTTVRWSITEEGAQKLWERYRTFESATSSLVTKASRDAIINAANDYTPNEARADQAGVAAKIKQEITSTVKDYGVNVDSVSILSIPLDEKTQASLDAIVAATNNVQRAQQEQERAKIDAETAKIRETSGALSPAALTRYCLEVANAWDQNKNGPLPATFNCALTGSSSVLVTPKQ